MSNGVSKSLTGTKDYALRLQTIASNGLASLAISLGNKKGLFKALAKVGSTGKPASANEVATEAGADSKLVEKWLATMASAGVIEVDKSGKAFWIPEELVGLILGTPDSMPYFGFFLNTFLPMFAQEPYKHMPDIMKEDGPSGLDYSLYKEFHKEMGEMSHTMHQQHLFTDFIDSIGMREALEKGIEVLDIGTGSGYHMHQFAKAFPNSRFTGIDFTASAIEQAKAEAKKQTLSHSCSFLACDAAQLPADWGERFDLVFNFHALHDQGRPDLSLLETHRVLKKGGLFAMLEWRSTSNVHADREKMGEAWSWFYGCSLLHCLPVGTQCPNAVQLGMMWGEEKGRKMLEESGFEDVTIEWPTYFPYNLLYKAKK